MTSHDWDVTLDAFERRLDAQWSALHDGAVEPVPPFVPPAASSPLPPELVERATQLVWRCRALEDALAAVLAKVGEQLERAGETPTGPPAQPVYFDSRI